MNSFTSQGVAPTGDLEKNGVERRLAAYCRVSTALQSSGLESQVLAIKDYCRFQNIVDIDIFTDEISRGPRHHGPALIA